MKFYGNGMVWDKAKNKPLCRFVGGVFETDDMEIAKKLVEIGYKCNVELIEITSSKSEYKEYKPKPKPKSTPSQVKKKAVKK